MFQPRLLASGSCSAPAVAGPTVINHCQTLPASGSYVFGKNLTAAGGRGGLDCLLLGDDFITIDLNGFSITGFAGQGTGIKLATNFGGGGGGFEIRGGTVASLRARSICGCSAEAQDRTAFKAKCGHEGEPHQGETH